MNPLIYFICGIVFVVLIMPILQGFSDFIYTKFEVYKSNMSVKITENNFKISKLNMELEPQSTHAIGFHVEDDYLYDDYEEDCLCKNKIGFDGGIS